MSFKKKRVKSRTLGEYLRECREHSELSPLEIGKLSQVQTKFIIALEEGDFQNLPESVYVKGFLKSLSVIYHVSYENLVTQYLGEKELAKNLYRVEIDAKKASFFAPRFIFSSKTVLIAGITILGIFSISYIYFQVASLKKPPMLLLLAPNENVTVNSAALKVQGKTEPGSTVYLNNQSIVVDAKGEFQENISLAPGSNFLEIRSVNRFGQSSDITRQILYQEKDIAGAATSTIPGDSESRMSLQVVIEKQAAWIRIVADGQEEYADTMPAGTRRSVFAKEKIILTTGNAGTTRVIHNGKDLGILGKEGEAITDIEFTPTL